MSTGEARLLQGAPIAAEIRGDAARRIGEVAGRIGFTPGIAVVLVGDDAPSEVYARRILRNADSIGAPGRLVRLPGDAGASQIGRELAQLSTDTTIGGIILQLPLPGHLALSSVSGAIDPSKDLDGIHPENAGRTALGYEAFTPSCAQAALEILLRSGYELAGVKATVVGRSNVVGKPAHVLLMRHDATVTVCHRKTRDLAAEVRAADVVVVAAGVPGLIRGEMVKRGAVVIDCGINVVDGAIVGDVDFTTVSKVASALTPVPGGVGPVTNAVLLDHLARAVERQAPRDPSADVASGPRPLAIAG